MTVAPDILSEEAFSKMVAGALGAQQGLENHILAVLQKARDAGGNGRTGLIALPNGPAVRLNIPGAQELSLLVLDGVRTLLQTQRIALIALNDLDSRFRLRNSKSERAFQIHEKGCPLPPDCNCGGDSPQPDPRRTQAGDKQPEEATGKVGDERGSQSPEVAS